MTRAVRLALAALALLALFALAPRARADALPPGPASCPPGQVAQVSHAGAGCVPEAPKDCPPGWHGVVGGTCALTPCESDASCAAGEACVEHSVCLQPFVDEYYDYGEDERDSQNALPPSRLLASPALLAGPPIPKKRRPTPITRYNAVNLCAPDVACAAPRTCQTEKLCAPKGARALAYRGTNISPARVARKTPAPLTSSDAPPRETAAPASTATPDASPAGPKRGCAGCAVRADTGDGALALPLALLALAVLRRKRCPER